MTKPVIFICHQKFCTQKVEISKYSRISIRKFVWHALRTANRFCVLFRHFVFFSYGFCDEVEVAHLVAIVQPRNSNYLFANDKLARLLQSEMETFIVFHCHNDCSRFIDKFRRKSKQSRMIKNRSKLSKVWHIRANLGNKNFWVFRENQKKQNCYAEQGFALASDPL